MTELTSKVITTLRFPLAVLVIACHSGFFSPPTGTILDGWDSWTLLAYMQLLVCEVLPHVSVPLFMLFSGMLFFRNGAPGFKEYFTQLNKKVRTLFVPYIIWSTLAFIVLVSDGSISFSFQHWLQGLWDSTLWHNGGQLAIDVPGYPMNMPLWFIRDLMVLVVLSYPIGKLLVMTRGWILALMAIWWFPGHEKFFGFGADVLFYYSAGAWISIKGIDIIDAVRKVRIPSYVFVIIMLVIESVITFRIFNETHGIGFKWIPFNIFVVSMMAATLNMAAAIVEHKKESWLVSLASCTFFLFASHFVALSIAQRSLYGILNPTTQAGNMGFFWLFLVGYVTILTALFYLLRRFCPKSTAFLTGGRI